jgi:GMP synthase PP-ATPase subunit
MICLASIPRSYVILCYSTSSQLTKPAGIAVRILGEVTQEKVEIARQADDIFISEIRKAGLYDKISQAYAAVDPSRAVGVMGDKRVYGYIIILRAVTTTDFMTAEACKYSDETIVGYWQRFTDWN